MRIGMMAVLGILAAMAGIAHGELDYGKPWSAPNYSLPAQEPPMMVAEATKTQDTAQSYDRVIGVCHLSESPFVPQSAVNVLSPSMEVAAYYRKQEHLTIGNQPSVSVLQTPVHGSLVDEGGGYYAYYPEKGYLGNDRATLLVEVGGRRVRMEYFFRVMQSIPQQYDETMPTPYEESNCPEKTRVWKISSATDVQVNRGQTTVSPLRVAFSYG